MWDAHDARWWRLWVAGSPRWEFTRFGSLNGQVTAAVVGDWDALVGHVGAMPMGFDAGLLSLPLAQRVRRQIWNSQCLEAGLGGSCLSE